MTTPSQPLPPSQLPCPKCGSMEIARRHQYSGDYYETGGDEYAHLHHSSYVAEDGRRGHSLRECIRHICKTCSYRWETKPLPKKRKERPEKPSLHQTIPDCLKIDPSVVLGSVMTASEAQDSADRANDAANRTLEDILRRYPGNPCPIGSGPQLSVSEQIDSGHIGTL